jgi:hypothetical protein
MNIALITSVSGKSCRALQKHLLLNGIKADIFKVGEIPEDLREYNSVFSYGCSFGTQHKHRINSSEATLNCVDKRKTFKIFNLCEVPTVRWWTNGNDIPKDARYLVVRQDANGRKAEDLEHWDRGDRKPLPLAELYTEYFEHIREYRVTVFFDQTFVYYKRYNERTDEHVFEYDNRPKLYRYIIQACQRARVGLGVDYASFDVLEDEEDNFVLLEANSGSILTDEVSTAIVEYYLNK